MKRILLGIGLALVGCGDDGSSADQPPVDGSGSGSGSDSGSGSRFELTSPQLAASATFAVDNTCSGANTSPGLAWSGAPSGTQSFAVVLVDKSIMLTHWVIYDIPASTTGLPAAIENTYMPSNVTGAHQTESASSPRIGYYGPCPPSGPAHLYQFLVYALDVAALPGGTAQTTRAEATAEIATHMLGVAALSGSAARP